MKDSWGKDLNIGDIVLGSSGLAYRITSTDPERYNERFAVGTEVTYKGKDRLTGCALMVSEVYKITEAELTTLKDKKTGAALWSKYYHDSGRAAETIARLNRQKQELQDAIEARGLRR